MKSKEQKRTEAEARAEKWRALTPQQKLEVLDAKRAAGLGEQRKERAKIYAANPELSPKKPAVDIEAIAKNNARTEVRKLNIKQGRVILR